MSLGPEPALQQARSLLHPGAAPPPGADTLALAWALKDLCYEAFSNQPPRAALAADALRAMLLAGVTTGQAREIEALADWTAGIVCITRGQMEQAVRCFDQAAAGLRAVGRPDPAAQTQVPKIMALSMLGQHAQAIACADATQRELRALGNLHAAARVSQNIGSLQARRDAYPEAARHFREAAVLFARLRDHEHSVLADIGLADALTATGDFDEALRVYARARMRAGHRGLTLQLALVDESVALLDLARGRYREALAGLEAARRGYEALALPQYLAIAEKQLADVYLELRLLPEALALLDAAVAKFSALALPDEQAWALAQRGRALARLGHDALAADACFVAAHALFAAQGNAVGVAAVVLARAELALAGADPQAALAGAEQAAAGYAAAGQADGQARADVVRAQALLGLGQIATAQAAFDATLARARAQAQLQVQVRCLTGLGLVAQASGDSVGASALFEAAIEGFEEQRRALPADEMRSAFLTDHLRPYEECLRIALAARKCDAAEVLWQLERYRARALDDRLGELPAEGTPAQPDDEAVQGLRERLNWLYRRLQRLHDEGSSSAVLGAEMQGIERDLLERARRLRLALPAATPPAADAAAAAPAAATGSAARSPAPQAPSPPPAAVSAGSAFSVAALQRALQDGDVLVEYGVQGDELLACVVTAQQVTLQRHLAPWGEVLEALRAARFQIETLSHGAAPVQRHLAVLAERARLRLARLHALVWAPLADSLAGARRVLVVPQAQLWALPFCALRDIAPRPAEAGCPPGGSSKVAEPHLLVRAPRPAEAGRPPGGSSKVAEPHLPVSAPRPAEAGRPPGGSSKVAESHLLQSDHWLGQRCQLAMVPSARAALRGLQRQPLPARRVLALGESSRLPHAAREALQVAGLYPQGQAHVGEQATLPLLLAGAGTADVLHLACHAQFRSDNPHFSALHLQDGALTVEQIEALALRPCTVVLSACDTGLAELAGGDEQVGLVRAFLVAGAARVVASLWPVDDGVAAGFMACFHAALVQGQAPAAALRSAQEATRRVHPHPCHWAAFTLYGGW